MPSSATFGRARSKVARNGAEFGRARAHLAGCLPDSGRLRRTLGRLRARRRVRPKTPRVGRTLAGDICPGEDGLKLTQGSLEAKGRPMCQLPSALVTAEPGETVGPSRVARPVSTSGAAASSGAGGTDARQHPSSVMPTSGHISGGPLPGTDFPIPMLRVLGPKSLRASFMPKSTAEQTWQNT